MDYLFAFNHDEARRSFTKAAEIDPKAAMPQWGVALAVGPNYNDIDIGNAREKSAVEAITKARQLAVNGPALETDYINALADRYGEDTKHDLHVQGERYATAMKALVARHPDDLDAAVLYAESLMDLHPWQLWSADGKPAPGTEEAVATLQSVILRDPSHVGANHFLIHAVEASPDPSLAIASAERLKTLAPAAGHLVHMPAHIYQRVGDFNDSAEANRKAITADQAYFSAEHMLPAGNMYYDMYYVHNIHFLASACNMEGNADCAIDAAKKLVDYTTLAYAKDKQVEWFMPTQPWMLVRFNRWDDILKAAAPPKEMLILTAFWHYARGSAYVALKQPSQAATEREALAAAIQNLPKDIAPDFNNPAKTALELALTVLDARTAEARIPNTQANRVEAITSGRRPSLRSIPSPTTNPPTGTTLSASRWAARCCATASPSKPKPSSAAIWRSTPAAAARSSASGKASSCRSAPTTQPSSKPSSTPHGNTRRSRSRSTPSSATAPQSDPRQRLQRSAL